MARWLLIYPMLILLLAGFALYEHIDFGRLSLPVPSAQRILTVILPVVALFNAIYYYLRVLRSAGPDPWQRLAITLQVLQAIVTTILATQFFSDVMPTVGRQCLLSTTWQSLFSAHDADSIRRIQDSFNCCGFNTIRDRSWPFPGQEVVRGCAETYGRSRACAGPWQTALQRNAAVEFAIVLGVGLLQIASLFWGTHGITRERNSGRRAVNESETSRLLPRYEEADGDEGSALEDEQGGYRTVANGGSRRDTAAHHATTWAGEQSSS